MTQSLSVMQFLREAGPLILPIVLLTVVIAALVIWNGLSLLIRRDASSSRRRQSIDGVLFWGAVGALLGFLGQWIGIHNLARAVAEKGIVDPGLVSYGISESLLTPIAGMVVLLAAALLWFLLRLGQRALEQRG